MSITQRNTKQRKAILKTLLESSRPLHPKEIQTLAGEIIPCLGIATVYRNLKYLVENGDVESINIPGKTTCYTAKRKAQRPILFCEKSNRIDLLPSQSIDVAMPELPEGFKLDRYEIIFYGSYEGGDPTAKNEPQA